MEFLPHETHMAELKLPGIGLIMACVDSRTNTWRLDPKHPRYRPPSAIGAAWRASSEAIIAHRFQVRIDEEGLLPNYIPDAIDMMPGSSHILARNYKPDTGVHGPHIVHWLSSAAGGTMRRQPLTHPRTTRTTPGLD